ncbi:hypothetical protein H4Q26_010558 [Puccinia striiformis f. sp. tritici PST-130]|uniref:Amino acid permease/ SLC12A domain-containing protein n=1 Tax=Puccinia striiformis f. sp. tritici PST-78 TaxID=1165861 RepID=A0A0L0UWI2_9BASI|nr:hypothetical protein H4Q26_010558 [Puccinia striiformis f. sp. tritici PST-130]KNE91089.1 hypothetical protein PSTG_15485 [Puccinia striiformis f. sp. tritici PST-78]
MEDESQTGLKSESGGKGSEEEGKRPEEGEGDSDSEEDILVYSQHRMGGDSISLLRNADCSPQTQSPVFDKHTRHRATSSASFSFSFSTHLLPLTNSLETVRHSVPTLNTTSAIALVVSSQIGSGIFSSPGILSQNCGSPGASLIVWTLAGILAWTGASSFAELGAAIPVNGGAQAYLNYSFGGWASYLFIWTNLVALKPGSAAIISIVGSEYLCRILYHTAFKASPSESAKAIPIIITKLVAILIMLTICFINGLSAKAGKHFPIILTLIKILSLLFIIIMALIRLIQGSQSHNFESANVFRNSSVSPSDLASALYSGLWAYDGWDSGNYIAGELKRATKTLPIVIHSSMGIVLTLMILTNWSYLIVLPMEVVTQSNTIGLEFGRVIFGPIGSFVFSLIVAFACFGALNSCVFTTSRLVSVAAEERYIPKVFSNINEKTLTPINALGLHAFLTIIMIGFGDFKSLVGFYGTCAWTFYLLTVGSLLLLRIREPDLERPYQTWVINPITFSTVASFLLLMPVFSAPLQSLAAFGFIIAGLPFYYLTTNKELRQFGFSKLKLFDLNSYKSSSGRDNNLSSFKALDTQDDDDPEDDDVNDHHGQETPVQK